MNAIVVCNREKNCVFCGGKNVDGCILAVYVLGRRRSGDKRS
jgi:hypothetical protein